MQSQRTLTISTDGSVLASGRQKGKDQGPGGWAFLVHETSEEISGCVESATNNQMELRAVIEAIRHIGIGHSIKIRTDSQYVSDAISNGNTIRSNQAMWRDFMELTKDKAVRVVWIKGHNGDKHNERADSLARNQAMKAKQAVENAPFGSS